MRPASALYDAPAMRALERAACEHTGLTEAELMMRAGAAAFATLKRRWPAAARIAVVCGGGNNGGDGYVLAGLARRAGLAVQVVQVGDPARMGPHALANRRAWCAQGGEVATDPAPLLAAEVVVDALFGIGLERPVGGAPLAAIEAINAARRSVLALDVPSGIDASTGAVRGGAVRATATITFIALKQGLVTGEAPAFTGVLELAELGLPPAALARVPACAERLRFEDLRPLLGARSAVAHKGDCGHVLVVGGAPGYAGAARLAAEAALRVGAGLVSVAAHPDAVPGLNAGRPEIMVHAVADAAALDPLIERASVVAVGPGLGQSRWAAGLFATARGARKPLVVDADGLNLLAADPARRDGWILTPHPGEAARLLGEAGPAAIGRDRFAAARALVERYGGIVILKGAGSLVCGAGLPAVVAGGNPGMASGGMGDVLTGVVAAVLAQGLPLPAAARYGAALHAAAGDRAAGAGERGMLASDLLPHLRALVN